MKRTEDHTAPVSLARDVSEEDFAEQGKEPGARIGKKPGSLLTSCRGAIRRARASVSS